MWYLYNISVILMYISDFEIKIMQEIKAFAQYQLEKITKIKI